MRAPAGAPPVEWIAASALVDYAQAGAEMEARVAAIAEGSAPRTGLARRASRALYGRNERQGRRSSRRALSRAPAPGAADNSPITGRASGSLMSCSISSGGGRTWRAFVAALEAWLIETLAAFDIMGERREDRVGVWVRRPGKPAGIDGSPAEDKIAALGIRVRRWVSFHGVALNVAPALSHFSGIVPCGIAQAHYGVTSLRDLGLATTMSEADRALRAAFEARFGETVG